VRAPRGGGWIGDPTKIDLKQHKLGLIIELEQIKPSLSEERERDEFPSLDCSSKIWKILRAIFQVRIENLGRKKNRNKVNETCDFYPVVRSNVICFPTPRCGVPVDKGCTQPLSSDHKDQLECHSFFLISISSFVRNLHNLESLTALHKIKITTQSKVGR
jgi:hypothetical protein